jgi:hypothetical protein
VGVKSCPTKRVQHRGQSVQAIIVTGGSINNVPGELGVVEFVGVADVLEDWSRTLVDVRMTRQNKIDRELVQRSFEGLSALWANVTSTNVRRAMTS